MRTISVVENLYHQYLKMKQERNSEKYKDFDGWLSASSTGQCYRKQGYRLIGEKQTDFNERTMRLLRLGTIIHDDIQTAIKDNHEGLSLVEHQIRIPKLKILGHLDIALVNKDIKTIKLIDIKTVASYKWRKQFGHKKNRDKNPSVNYELQLGTYAEGLQLEYPSYNIGMAIFWYNKDNSAIKEIMIPDIWRNNAMVYWEDLKETLENVDIDDLIPGMYPNVPVMDWECKYCQFKDNCGGI